MENETGNYGKATVRVGTNEKREIDVVEFIQSRYKDNRIISVAKLEDETLILGVENPKSTGRAVQTTLWLSKESAIGLLSTLLIYFTANGVDFAKLLADSIDTDDINITYTDNMAERIKASNILPTP